MKNINEILSHNYILLMEVYFSREGWSTAGIGLLLNGTRPLTIIDT
ncbi:hypothetical protein [Sphingobacterium griseoflavum]|nr:hypothetical protein [Sphingobacterium griseoflavum]